MSPREKRLLIFFGSAGFIVLNFLGFNFFNSTRLSVEAKRAEARRALDTAETYRSMSGDVGDQMDWLDEHEPEPAAYQDVQTDLQQFVEREASSAGLLIKSQKPLPIDTTSGVHYHRAKVQLNVTGTEEALYRWFDRVNVPEAFRSATYIRLKPDTADDTRIDCIVTVEQWFVPADAVTTAQP
jgi:hypothetical protein